MKTKFMCAALVVSTTLLAPSAHAATVTGAKLIEITNSSVVQVGEVIAIQAFTGIDVALATNGATASAPAYITDPAYAIDGIYPASYPNIFHGGTSLSITLAAPADLASLTIYGRYDCCQTRDIYNVKIYDALNDLIFSGILDAGSSVAGGDIPGVNANPYNDSATVTFDVATPLPATLPLFASGLGAMGLLGWRRKRKASAALAA